MFQTVVVAPSALQRRIIFLSPCSQNSCLWPWTFFRSPFFSFEVLHRINNTTPPFLMLDYLRMGDTHELIRVKDSWSGSNENWFYTQTFPSNIYIHQKRASRQKVSRAPKSRQCISQIRTIGGCTNSTTKNIRLTIQITENVSVGQLSWSWNWQDERG